MREWCQTDELPPRPDPNGNEGYMLLAVVVMVFLVLLALSVAAPKVAMELKHDQEMETQHRGNQYVRAIRVYYRKTGHYPGSVEQLMNTNNQKFLRQKYLDPMTGKDDWKLIMVGQNKTTVKGFFGEDLPGMAPGLGAVAGMGSSTGSGATTGSSSGSGGTGSSFGAGSSFGIGSGNGSAGQTGSSFGGTSGGSGTTGSGSGTSGMGEQDATSFTGGSAGPIMGVGVSKSGQGFLSVNGEDHYENWEFLYDPRIEQLYAKGNLLGGGGAMSGGTGSGAFPNSGTSSGFPGSGTSGSGSGSGTGSSGSGSGSGSGSTPPGTPQ
jgi:type II secretory pathway pseudopilin PulG